MSAAMVWIPMVLGGLVLVGVLAAVLLFRLRPHLEGLSPEERAEMASAPMPCQQKRAWWGLLIGVVTLSVISAILFTRGAAEYWENDDLRLLVVGIFLGGLFAYVGTLFPILAGRYREEGMDEVDRLILSRTPNVQSAAVLVTPADMHRAAGQPDVRIGLPCEHDRPVGGNPAGLLVRGAPCPRLRSATGSEGCASTTTR